jgi:hypothetical protein
VVNQWAAFHFCQIGIANGPELESLLMETEVEPGMTFGQAMRLMSSVLLGKVDTVGGVTRFRDVNDTTDRVEATLSGVDRASVTYDGG